MGIFSIFKKDYSKPGPGVPKNAPRKKGFARFIELLGRDFGNLVKLNVIYALCLLPAQALLAVSIFCYLGGAIGGLLLFGALALAASIVVGPATTTVFYIISKMLRDEPGFVWHDFKERFKKNFKCTAVPGMLFSLMTGSQIFAYIIYTAVGASWILVALYLFAFILVGMATPYFYVQSAYLDLKPSGILKNSFLLAIGKFPRSIMGFLFYNGLLLLQFSYIHLSFMIVLVMGYTIPMLLCMMWIWPPIDATFKIEETLNKRKADEISEALEQSGWTDENAAVRQSNKF